MSAILDLLLLSTGWLHVFLAPYTKVEESFNLHATHDVLFYGIRPGALRHYDHFIFPGAVPRTFIGSVILAWVSTPVIRIATSLGLVHSKFDLQIIVRLVLSTLTSLPHIHLLHTLDSAYGLPTTILYTILACTQFHLPFWTSRTLPNSFALIPVLLATSLLIPRYPSSKRPSQKRLEVAVGLLISTAVILRAEVSAMLFPIVASALWQGYISIGRLLKVGVVSGLISLAATVLVDSYFWQTRYLLWPEFAGVYFNVFQGKSAEWGVSPMHEYVTVHLPKLLLASLPLSVVAMLASFFSRRKARVGGSLGPAVVFVMLMSCLGHKEWRFIVYVVPSFNIAAARGGLYLASALKSTVRGRLAILTITALILCNIAATALSLQASAANYPGGVALARFNDLYVKEKNVHVHISDLAAQSGASLFLQQHSAPYLPAADSNHHDWIYDKSPLEQTAPSLFSSSKMIIPQNITHLIVEPHQLPDGSRWKVVSTVEGFERWEVRWDLWKRLRGREGLGTLVATRDIVQIMPLKKVMGTKLVLVERT